MIAWIAWVKKGAGFNSGATIFRLRVPKGEIFAFLVTERRGKDDNHQDITTPAEGNERNGRVDGRNPKNEHENEVRQSFGIGFSDPSLDQDLTAGRPWICTACSSWAGEGAARGRKPCGSSSSFGSEKTRW